MVRVDAHRVAFHVERSGAHAKVTHLVLVQVAPAEDARVHHVRKTLAACDLQKLVKKFFAIEIAFFS